MNMYELNFNEESYETYKSILCRYDFKRMKYSYEYKYYNRYIATISSDGMKVYLKELQGLHPYTYTYETSEDLIHKLQNIVGESEPMV